MACTWNILTIEQINRAPHGEYAETRVRDEIKRGLGLRAYVPVERRQIQFAHRCKVLEVPLITGYVFVSGDYGIPWRDVRELMHVRGWFKRDDERPYELSDLDVQVIRQFELDHASTLFERKGAMSRPLAVGDRVRVQGSPFGSIESLLRAVRGSAATIEVNMLGSVRDVQVPVSSLEKVA